MTARRLLRRPAAPDGLAGAQDMPGPPALEITARHVQVGDDYAATLAITGYPAEVAAGWLEPLLTYPCRLDVTLHIEPIPAAVAAARLRRQRARLESGRRAGASRGQLDDPGTEAAADDARDLAYRLARGEGHLFRLGLYLTVHAATEDDLHAEVAAVRALAASLLLVTVPATFRSLQGWTTTLPAGTDTLALRRTMDTAALAASFPFTSPDLPRDPAAPNALPGVLYGANTAGPGLVAWDRWAAPNHNSVTLAASGAGKSYLAKLEILRSLYQGTECWVIDPEDEYARLAAAVGGAYVHLGAPDVHLNPFDLPAAGRARPDALTRRALFLHTLVAVLLGAQPPAAEHAALDKAIMAAYQQAGITTDPRTWARPAPLLPALAAALRAARTGPATAVADRLVPFTEGTHAAMFAAPTTTRPEGHLVVFSLRDVPDELRPAATLLALDATWRQVCDPAQRRKRLITVDEAWLLMRDSEGAKFLYRLAKSARKAWAGLAAVTQDAEDVLATDLGRAVIANSATQILLRQAPQAITKITEEFHLSAGERALLLAARRGEGLLAAGPSARVSFQALASPAEHFLCTSDPAEIARLEAGQGAGGAPAWPPAPGNAGPAEEENLLS
jgi:type IV secretory pathway VirB4 component